MNSSSPSFPTFQQKSTDWLSIAEAADNDYDMVSSGEAGQTITHTLLQVSSELLSTHDLELLLRKILKFLQTFIIYDTAAIHLVQDDYLYTSAGVGDASCTIGQKNFHKDDDFVWQYLEREKAPYVTADLQEEAWKPLSGFEYIRSFMAVPLAVQDELLGVLTVDHKEPDMYDAHQVEVVRLFANHAALAIQNARLLAESQRYIKDLEILQTVGLFTVSNTSEINIAEGTLQTLQEAFGYDLVSIYRVEGDVLRLLAQNNYPLSLVSHEIPIARGITGQCLRQRQPVLIPDVSSNEEFVAAPGIRSRLCVPILIDGSVYGIINVESKTEGALGQNDLRLLTILANKLAVAFQNLRLYEQTRRRLLAVSALHAGSVEIVSEMEESELFDSFLERVRRLIRTSLVGLFLYEPETEQLVAAAVQPENPVIAVGDGQPPHTGVLGQAFTKNSAIYTSDYTQYPHRDPHWPQEIHPLGAVGAVPLALKGKPLGVLALAKEKGHRFNDEERQTISLLANQIATAIENRRLFQTEQRRNYQLALLNEITTTSFRADDFQETLETLANRLGSLIDADGCFINLWDETLQRPIPTAAYGPIQDQFRNIEVEPGESTLTSHVLTTGKELVVEEFVDCPYVSQRLVDQFPIHSALALPLQVDDQKIGAAVITFTKPHRFSEDEINIGKQAANQISIAIAKAQLLQTERQQRQFAEVQLDFSFKLMETNSLVGAVEALLQTVTEVVGYDIGSVMLLEPDRPQVGYFAAVSGYTDPDEARSRTVNIKDFPLLRRLAQEGMPIYIPDVRTSEIWRPGHRPDPEEVRSILLAPLIYNKQSELIGCLTLKSYRPNAFSREARANITLLCNQTASAVRNVRLFEETRRRLNEVSILAEMSETLNRTFTLDAVLQLVLDRVVSIIEQTTGARNLQGSIILRQQPGDLLRLATGYNLPEEYEGFFNSRPFYAHEGTFARSILRGEWVELETPQEIEATVAEIPEGLHLSELLNIPLKVGSEVIGVITANCIVRDPTTRRLLGAIAELAGSAIHKTRLLDQARDRAVELMEAYEALNQMDRERDEFIQNVTHDLKAPLSFIRGYTELMVEGAMGDVNADQKEALEIILERTDAVTRLVGEILKVKQVESQPLKQESVDIAATARTAVRSALMAAKKAGLSVDLTVDAEHTHVRGDADRLGQVFDNLLSNAIKYTNEGGRIHVQISQRWPKVIVSVTDTGIGIPLEEVDRIWDRYYRVHNTREAYSGTGLGLANVRRIVEAHGGHIWVQSGNKGTTFMLELPLEHAHTSLS